MDPNPQPAWLPFAIVAGFLIVFPLFWCFVCVIISWTGGWSRLAKKYPAPLSEPAQGRTLTWRSGRVGLANYKSTLTIGIEPSGLRFSVMPLFRAGHPPLFIPWTDIKNRRPARFAFFSSMQACDVGSPVITTLVLPEEVFEGQPEPQSE